MIIVFVAGDEKRIFVELDGREKVEEVKKILAEYLSEKNIQLSFRGQPIHDLDIIGQVRGIRPFSEIEITVFAEKGSGKEKRFESVIRKVDRSVNQEFVEKLVSDGFNQEKVESALARANNDLSLAKQLLMLEQESQDVSAEDEYKKFGIAARQVIERLKKSGKSFDEIVKTYVLCHRDEVQTKRILFSGL